MSEISTLWKVNNVKHVIEDGGVIEVSYSATTSSGEASVYNGGQVTLEYDASDSKFVPLSDLTEEVVMGWVKDSLGEEVVSEMNKDILRLQMSLRMLRQYHNLLLTDSQNLSQYS